MTLLLLRAAGRATTALTPHLATAKEERGDLLAAGLRPVAKQRAAGARRRVMRWILRCQAAVFSGVRATLRRTRGFQPPWPGSPSMHPQRASAEGLVWLWTLVMYWPGWTAGSCLATGRRSRLPSRMTLLWKRAVRRTSPGGGRPPRRQAGEFGGLVVLDRRHGVFAAGDGLITLHLGAEAGLAGSRVVRAVAFSWAAWRVGSPRPSRCCASCGWAARACWSPAGVNLTRTSWRTATRAGSRCVHHTSSGS